MDKSTVTTTITTEVDLDTKKTVSNVTIDVDGGAEISNQELLAIVHAACAVVAKRMRDGYVDNSYEEEEN